MTKNNIPRTMNRRFTGLLTIGIIVTLLTFASPFVSFADGNDGTSSYRLKISSHITIKSRNAPDVGIEADTILAYTWKRRNLEKTLSIDSLYVKATQNGKEIMNSSMSRAKIVDSRKGKTEVTLYEDAPEGQKEMLRDSFGAPVCKFVTDRSGKKISRTVIAGPGAKGIIDETMINNAVMFHPMFPGAREQWQDDFVISMGNGGFARGKLTYRKQSKKRAGQTRLKVSVSGTVKNDVFNHPGTGMAVKDAIYIVTGTQTYDTAMREWVSGELIFDISFKMEHSNTPMGSAKGKMKVTLKMLPVKR